MGVAFGRSQHIYCSEVDLAVHSSVAGFSLIRTVRAGSAQGPVINLDVPGHSPIISMLETPHLFENAAWAQFHPVVKNIQEFRVASGSGISSEQPEQKCTKRHH